MLRGMWLGFCIAAPVGPIGILVMKQALRRGWLAGLTSGLGAAAADLLYGCLAVAGVRMIPGDGGWVGLLGGLFLFWLAWRLWHEKPSNSDPKEGLLVTFALTLSNPMTILSFAAMVATVGAGSPVQFVAGVFLGSMLWWTILSVGASRLRAYLNTGSPLLQRGAALTLACFGAWAILQQAR